MKGKVLGLDHVGVAVRDPRQRLPLWAEALGLPLDRAEAVPSEGVRTWFLDFGGGHIELLEPLSADSPIARAIEKRGEGLHHVCLAVDDLDAALARLAARGIEPVGGGSRPGAGGCTHRVPAPEGHRRRAARAVAAPARRRGARGRAGRRAPLRGGNPRRALREGPAGADDRRRPRARRGGCGAARARPGRVGRLGRTVGAPGTGAADAVAAVLPARAGREAAGRRGRARPPVVRAPVRRAHGRRPDRGARREGIRAHERPHALRRLRGTARRDTGRAAPVPAPPARAAARR